ncbi:hypothetical protein NUU61_003501 [Penicillium alfredii]|uniref:NmrA-like domain-containing protein n=1 Tax=Penicillium alfredii TaxID=1506179 RepID=A0A9W9KCI5_9EURO|nr:uncharacterized protein NUU61_003501 [Penicillium alfredii]KAJ5101279.1 hypothetical protein NUU61_003501 [Penicillium alfredii]
MRVLPNSSQAIAPLIGVSTNTGNFVRAALNNRSSSGANTIYAASGYYTFEQVASDFTEVLRKPLRIVSVSGKTFRSFLSPPLPLNIAQEIEEYLVLLEGAGYYAGADLTASLGLLSESPVTWKKFLVQNKGSLL